MKIVVNRCYGGFGLSLKAQKEYCKRKGLDVFFYKQTAFNFKAGYDEYRRIDNFDEPSSFLFSWLEDKGEVTQEIPCDNEWFFYREIPRNDPDLIAVVETMGEEADGFAAELDIVEIPDDVSWQIEEYDGREWVSETHRTW